MADFDLTKTRRIRFRNSPAFVSQAAAYSCSNSAHASSQECQSGVGSLTFALKQFFASFHLRIVPITNFEPCALFSICRVAPSGAWSKIPRKPFCRRAGKISSHIAQHGLHTAAEIYPEARTVGA